MPTSLYLTEAGALLQKEAGQLLITRDGEVRLAVPAARVDQVVVVGGATVTTPALAFLLDHHIDLVFLTAGGAYRGRLVTDDAASLPLHQAQYRRAEDDAFGLAVGKAIVAGKIRNARTLLMRLDTTNAEPHTGVAVADLRGCLEAVAAALDRAGLMGLEGDAARRYFAALRVHLRPPWVLPSRQRRPPPDPVNALLSALYTLLHERCYAALLVVGLDPRPGLLHQPRAGRAALALDLMEEFRAIIADSVALTLLNKQMLAPKDFVPAPSGTGVHLGQAGWEMMAGQFGRRLQTTVTVPGRSTKVTYQKLLEVQARQLRAVILGEQAQYRPFLAK